MPTYFARDSYTYAGTNSFTVTFPYIEQSHVEVYVEGTLVDAADVTWVNSTTIQIDDPVLVTDDAIVIKRNTSQSARIVDYEGDSVLREADLDNDSLQAFYMAQEAMDRAEQAFDAAGGTGP